MAISLEGAINAFNRIMPDVVQITRAHDSDLGIWNDTTMRYDPPVDGAVTLYRGPGLVGNTGPGQETVEGRQDIYKTSYTVRTPLGTGPRADFQPGDRVTVIKASINKEIEGQRFRVTEELHSSYAVSRRLLVDQVVGEWQ